MGYVLQLTISRAIHAFGQTLCIDNPMLEYSTSVAHLLSGLITSSRNRSCHVVFDGTRAEIFYGLYLG